MAQSKCNNSETRGFTLAEVCVSIAVLTIGLVAAAAMFGKVWGSTAYSEYMIQASTLASEKLEDLNRYPSSDPNVAVPNGTSAGSLTSNVLQNVTVNGVTESVNYYDEVFFSPTQGALVQTTSAFNANGNVQYSTITYTPNGTISSPVLSSTAPSTGGSTVFQRQWLIELNQPVNGVRRITVLVTLENQQVKPPVTFQLSMVRP